MRLTFLGLALLGTLSSLAAQTLDFRGVAPDAAIVFATASTRGLQISESPAAKALWEKVRKLESSTPGDAEAKKLQAALQSATGVDFTSSDIRFAGGLNMSQGLPAPDGSPGPMTFSGGVIIHAKYDGKKLAAYCAQKKVPTQQAGSLQGWDVVGFATALTADGANPSPALGALSMLDEKCGLFPVDDQTLLVAFTKDAEGFAQRLQGKAKSYELVPALRTMVTQTGKPYTVLAVNAAKLPADPKIIESGFQGALFAMGEQGNSQVMKVSAFFTTPAKAAPVAAQAQGMLALIQMMMADDPQQPKTEQDKVIAEAVGKMLAGLQPLETQGSGMTLTGKWDTAQMIELLDLFMTEAQKSFIDKTKKPAAK